MCFLSPPLISKCWSLPNSLAIPLITPAELSQRGLHFPRELACLHGPAMPLHPWEHIQPAPLPSGKAGFWPNPSLIWSQRCLCSIPAPKLWTWLVKSHTTQRGGFISLVDFIFQASFRFSEQLSGEHEKSSLLPAPSTHHYQQAHLLPITPERFPISLVIKPKVLVLLRDQALLSLNSFLLSTSIWPDGPLLSSSHRIKLCLIFGPWHYSLRDAFTIDVA